MLRFLGFEAKIIRFSLLQQKLWQGQLYTVCSSGAHFETNSRMLIRSVCRYRVNSSTNYINVKLFALNQSEQVFSDQMEQLLREPPCHIVINGEPSA